MDAMRSVYRNTLTAFLGARIGAILEWVVAAGFILAMLAVGSLVAGEFRTVSAVMPVIAREAPAPVPPTPAGVPSRAVSVPVLLLTDGKEVRVGETISTITSRLGTATEWSPPTVERAPGGERTTHFYAYGETRFVLVFEPFERGAEPRIAAIYRP
jgi:hypothetical protein